MTTRPCADYHWQKAIIFIRKALTRLGKESGRTPDRVFSGNGRGASESHQKTFAYCCMYVMCNSCTSALPFP